MNKCWILLLWIALYASATSALCGDGVLDFGELCDTQLSVCCNSTCSGYHETVYVRALEDATCVDDTDLALRPEVPFAEIEWGFALAPPGASPSIVNGSNVYKTEVYFDGDGLYRVEALITTELCGSYYTQPRDFVISDCCGNGRLDHGEQCDASYVQDGCCDEAACRLSAVGTPCLGNISDECTASFSCRESGLCVSVQDEPFDLTALSPLDIADTVCSVDAAYYYLQSAYTDPDSTPGAYTWTLTVVDQFPPQHRAVGASAGSGPAGQGTINATVLMMGGGFVDLLLEVFDGCSLRETLRYRISRECCGNLVLNTGEACDDGNHLDGDYCAGNCSANTGYCGDAVVQSNEFCDYVSQLCCQEDCQQPVAASAVCRDAFGVCDLQETCDGTSPECPEDRFANSSVVCQASAGACGAPDTCTGHSPLCPLLGGVLPSTVECRASQGVCDPAEYCDGSTASCPADVLATHICRRSVGQCDLDEYCDGGSADCPDDQFANSSASCVADGAACDTAFCVHTNGTCAVASVGTCSGNLTVTPSYLSACIFSTCDTTTCVDTVFAGRCFIDGQCYVNGERNPGNDCLVCSHSVDAKKWTHALDGAHCATETPTGACSAQDTCSAGVCVERYRSNATVCRAANGTCDRAENCTGVGDECPLDAFAPPSQECRAAAGDCDAAESCTGYGRDCPPNVLLPPTTVCRGLRGPCDVVEVCTGASADCPVDQFLDFHAMCRGSAGVCDPPEYCDGATAACPDDLLLPASSVCRASGGACDPVEYCTGVGVGCPINVLYGTETVCRPPADACDAPESCTGFSSNCPADQLAVAGAVCRPADGACDAPETCDGVSIGCPADQLRPSGYACRPANGTCDVAETCSGLVKTCPANRFHSAAWVCRPPVGVCDKGENCTGGSADCPADIYQAADYVCRAPAGDCDAAENCTGAATTCPADLKLPSGTLCRPSNGTCDVPETCNGVTDGCPADVLLAEGVVCRAPAGECDQEETCTGVSPQCPADLLWDASVVCRASAGSCDRPERCTGSSAACPADGFHGRNVTCARAFSQCSASLNCSGSSAQCTGHSSLPQGAFCNQDGLACTTDQCDGSGACVLASRACFCSQNADCDVSFSCLIPTCVGHSCQQALRPGHCFVDGRCWDNGRVNPNNPCQSCQSSVSAVGWTPLPSGTHCDTGSPGGPCAAQDTCNGAGACLDRRAVGSVCREAVSVCDVPETCESSSDECPANAVAPEGVSCHTAAGPCDVDLTCSGESDQCPRGVFAPPSRMCRTPVSTCDAPEYCSGGSVECPADAWAPSTKVCRQATGPCDAPEYCTGDSLSCPADGVRPSGYVCRGAAGGCDVPETCDGALKGCLLDAWRPEGYVCAASDGPCRQDAVCNGAEIACRPGALTPAGTVCRAAQGRCDRAEVCDGVEGECPNDEALPAGTICRFSRGACDPEERCDGEELDCPEDLQAPAGTLCRVAEEGCDVPEYCDGESDECPANQKRPDGYPCPDGVFCNGDETCFSGRCERTPRNCSSGERQCSYDLCDEGSKRCVHATYAHADLPCYEAPLLTAGVGLCRAGALRCLNGSASCFGAVSPVAEICGNGRDDNCNGLVDEGCTRWSCVTDGDCAVSAHFCKVGACVSERCVYEIETDYCLIEEACYPAGTPQPHNPCKQCLPAVTAYGWTNYDAANVSDGDVCNGVEVCRGGRLYLNPKAPTCLPPSISCANSTCDPVLGCSVYLYPDNTTCPMPGLTCSEEPRCLSGVCRCTGEILAINGWTVTDTVIICVAIGLVLIVVLAMVCVGIEWWTHRGVASFPPLLPKKTK